MLHTTITAGKYKGKKIFLPSLESTRSTKSILKGSFFNTFQNEMYDACFIEAFGGSGSMGLEALSRGAKHAYFIEKDKNAFEILRKNCLSIDEKATTCIRGDSFLVLPGVISKLTCKAFFYFDPPFSIREGMDTIYDKTVEMIASLPPSCVEMITIEHMSTLTLPSTLGVYTLQKSKKFGNSSLSYYM